MTSALEDIKQIDLEEWLTLATAPSPTKLKLGQSPAMENVWTDEKPGSVITAPGFIKVGQIPSGNPVTFCLDYFKTSAGTQTFVVSDNSTVWTTADFQTFTSIITGLSPSFQLRGIVVRDKLWLTNGSDAVRTFDGTTVVVLDGTGGTPTVPRARYIVYHDERVWLYHVATARSAVYFSSLTDSSANIITPDNVNAWDTTDNFLQISEGDADFGTGLLIYRGYLFLFKQYSIWRLVGYDEYTYSRVKTRASTGTRFNESLQILDSLVHLIGVDGIYVFDGEESDRISDLINPVFNQFQQPNQNNQFWEVGAAVDWNSGTVPSDISVTDSLTLKAADQTQSDFQSGVVQSNVDLVTNPGTLQLSHTSLGASSLNLVLGQPPVLTFQTPGNSQIGALSFFTDNDFTNAVGFSGPGLASVAFPLIHNLPVTTLIFKGLIPGASSGAIQLSASLGGSNVPLTLVSASGGGASIDIPNQIINFPSNTAPNDITVVLTGFVADTIVLSIYSGSGLVMTECQVFAGAYNTTGDFTSKTLDLGITPVSLGNFNITGLLNGPNTAWTFFTQTSADGLSWDADVAVLNGGAITSVPRRYIRWGAHFTSDGINTPQVTGAYLPAVYISAIHNTGGSIFSWGPFEASYSLVGQLINFYYRTATTSGGIAGATWKLIVPGGVISDPIANQYVQFKIEISGGLDTNLPVIDSVTINWVVGTASQGSTLQNVASAYWKNRYWLSAAGPNATSNDTILIRGKKTFQSPWMLKDWQILSFTRFYDSLYGGSSVDGSIYQLDNGYSKAGGVMDSYFETGDFVFGGFTANFLELVVEVERLGSYSMNVGISFDNGNTWTDYPIDLTQKTFDNNYIKRININYTTTRIRFRFRTIGVDVPFQVHRCVAFYKLGVERGSIRGDYIPA